MPIPHRVRGVTNWLPYSDQKRSRKMWHINKSNSSALIIQFTSFLKISLENNLERKSWDYARTILKRKMSQAQTAAPRISDSRIGTLKSDIYQMGFIKYENNGYIITEAGFAFIDSPKETLLGQFLKLQYTNPTIIPYCKDIYLFPIIALVKLIVDPKIGFLEKDEIGLIVFMKFLFDDDFEDIKDKILQFRNLDKFGKRGLIKEFKTTPEGHVALAAASTVTYLTSRLLLTDAFEYIKKGKSKFLYIKETYKPQLEMEVKRYENISPFPYTKNKGIEYELWFEYFGNPKVKRPPQLKEIFFNGVSSDFIVNIKRNSKIEASYHISGSENIAHPFFNDNKYEIEVYIGEENDTKLFKVFPIKDQEIIIDLTASVIKKIDKHYYFVKIIELLASKDFDSELKNKINYIINKYDRSNFNTPSIRGARLEELFYKVFVLMKEELGLLEVIWKGKVDEYGIPHQTPGGPNGNPDLVLVYKGHIVLIELTTNASKSGQENSESLNIVRHARNFLENNKDLLKRYNLSEKCVSIIFSAPVIHKDLVKSLSVILDKDKIPHDFLTIKELLRKFKDRSLDNNR